jgi:starch synthase
MKLKILFAAAECAPLIRVGGLADIVGSLSKALRKLDVEVAIALPGYRGLVTDRRGSSSVKTLPDTDIPLFIVEHKEYFGASEKPYLGKERDPKRFAYFSRQVVSQLVGRGAGNQFKPDIIHVCDWHTSLIPALVRGLGTPPATVLTIYNLAMQGISPRDVFFPAGLSVSDLHSLDWDFQDRKVDFLLQGILNTSVISTVSPTYAREIMTPEFGEGLHDILKVRGERVLGVLNGIDYVRYNPARDKAIFQTYDLDNFSKGKAANKEALQKELGLTVNKEAMLVGLVARLVDQKGLSLLSEGLERMMELPLQFVVVGEGDKRYERQLADCTTRHPSKFSTHIGKDDSLARKVYAAADLFLIPSRFEPCGSSQMVAMRYGALPLVRAAGGLRDSVIDGKDGFVFEKYEAGQMLATLRRTLRIFGTASWKRMVEQAMQRDFSWEKAAEKHLKLYERALELAKEDWR